MPRLKNAALALPGTLRLLNQAWQAYTSKFANLVSAMVLPVLASIGATFLFGALFGVLIMTISHSTTISPAILNTLIPSTTFWLVGGLLFLASILVQILVMSWLQSSVILVLRGEDSKTAVKKIWQVLPGFFGVALLPQFLIFGAWGVFLIPGMAASIWFIFSGYIYLTQNKKGMAALWAGKAMVQGRWWEVFGRLLIGTLIIVIPIIIIQSLLLGIFGQNNVLSSGLTTLIQILSFPLIMAFINELFEAAKPGAITIAKAQKKTIIWLAVVGFILWLAGGFAIWQIMKSVPYDFSKTPAQNQSSDFPQNNNAGSNTNAAPPLGPID